MKRKSLFRFGMMLMALLLINVGVAYGQAQVVKSEIITIVEDPTDIEENVFASPQGQMEWIDISDLEVVEKDTLGPVYQVVDEMPEFPGGNAALLDYLRKNVQYPEVAKQFDIEGRVLVSFIVEPDGSIDSIKTAKSLQLMVDMAACRVIAEMPKWKPGKQNGKAVRVSYTVPVNFRLAETNQTSKDNNENKRVEKYSFTSLVSMVTKGNKEMNSPIVADDPSDVNNKCLSLTTAKSPAKSSDTQLMLYCNQPFRHGDTILFSIKAKAVNKQKVTTELHSTPGTLIVPNPFDFSEIGTEWAEYSSSYRVNNPSSQAIVLNLADKAKGNVCFFDDIKIEVHHAKMVYITPKPEFPGGVEALKKYLSENNKYPAQKSSSTVYQDVSFFVEADGSLSDIHVVGGLNEQLDEEAIRLVSGMPKWIPATISGRQWRYFVTIPIAFDNMNMVVTRKDDNASNLAYMVVEDFPEFPGGNEALLEFLRRNIMYPTIARENNIQGRVIVTFVVNRDGSISDAEVVKGVSPVLDREALRVISTMPHWKPGMQRGKPVRVKYTVPVNFRLN
ncbi:MAG: TonB family protein [Bacteroidaceae bacterium]|nr:TonB family protein [Bacteroidaceae bacterium]